ncbi:MAG: myo-inositol-1(or 4)-monophosphatase [Parcubacteria group bacterium Gr01-1014_19]|nr:MAG: myo-inositol-1(or 4)-monophosphatase [Parcubacteria group bacterium Gr01-1014_19]
MKFDSDLIQNSVARLSASVRIAVKAVMHAGEVAQKADRGAKTKDGEGHRSVVTQGDQRAEAVLVEEILQHFPKSARILSEEDADNQNMLKKDCPDGLMEATYAYIIDPVDGTAPYGSYLGNWCVSAGVMQHGEIVGGAVYAPDLNGGMLLVSDRERCVRVIDPSTSDDPLNLFGDFAEPVLPKNATVFFGVDSMLYPSLTKLMPEIAANVRVTGIANSGILALAQVACGRITAVIQTPQKAWDWAGAYRAVLETGRIFSFFRLVPDSENPGTDKLVEVGENTYDFDAFKYEKRNRLGYVAGEPAMVRRLMRLLPRKGYARTNPETVSGNWK